MRSLAGKVASFLVLSGVAGAQQPAVRGAVRDGPAGNALAGVVVTALDSAGTVAGRALTDASGRFFLPAVSARRLHLIRIGYRPRDVELDGPARGGKPIDVAMERLPPVLEAVRVVGSELCPGSPSRGAAFQAWEEARAGLLAAIVSRELKPANATTVLYESASSPTDGRVRRQRSETKSGQTTRPFIASAAPAFFAERGYLVEDASGRQFNAPDADVLLDESFAATHCFRLQPADSAHAGQTGVAFAPVRDRDGVVDVRGVVWLDGATPRLRSLDFAYTSLEPAAEQARAGGHIEFHSMPNGVSFIERWNLRLPVLEVATTSARSMRRDDRPPRRQDRFDLRVAEIVDAGGGVLDARWADGQTFHEPRSGVNGRVTRRAGGVVAGAIVTLAGTGDSAVTDTAGRFELETLPGRYQLIAVDTTLAMFVTPRSERLIVNVERGAMQSASVSMAPIAEVARDVCRGERIADSAMIMVGRAWRDGAAPFRGARVHAGWQNDFTKNAISGLVVRERTEDVSLDDEGRFVVCGVSRERPVRLQLRRGDERLADTTVMVPRDGVTMPVNWRVGKPQADSQPNPDRADGLGRADAGPGLCHTETVTRHSFQRSTRNVGTEQDTQRQGHRRELSCSSG